MNKRRVRWCGYEATKQRRGQTSVYVGGVESVRGRRGRLWTQKSREGASCFVHASSPITHFARAAPQLLNSPPIPELQPFCQLVATCSQWSRGLAQVTDLSRRHNRRCV